MKRLFALISVSLILLGGEAAQAQTPTPPPMATPLPVGEPELLTAREVKAQYYLSLPTGWAADKPWPIVVTLAGASHAFLNNCRLFVVARKDQPFIIVTPCVSSNGNDPADREAVLAIVREVRQDRHGEAKFYVDGFSAGAHLAWQLIFMHPDLLAGAVPAAGNYRARGIADISTAPERVRLPIHGFQGDKDGGLQNLTDQWNEAVKTARAHGYENIERTTVPGVGHSPFPEECLAFFAKLRAP